MRSRCIDGLSSVLHIILVILSVSGVKGAGYRWVSIKSTSSYATSLSVLFYLYPSRMAYYYVAMHSIYSELENHYEGTSSY